MKLRIIVIAMAAIFLMCQTAIAADVLNVVIMASKNPRKEGPKYQALSDYIKANTSAITALLGIFMLLMSLQDT